MKRLLLLLLVASCGKIKQEDTQQYKDSVYYLEQRIKRDSIFVFYKAKDDSALVYWKHQTDSAFINAEKNLNDAFKRRK